MNRRARQAYDHWWTLNDLFYLSYSDTLGGGLRGSRFR